MENAHNLKSLIVGQNIHRITSLYSIAEEVKYTIDTLNMYNDIIILLYIPYAISSTKRAEKPVATIHSNISKVFRLVYISNCCRTSICKMAESPEQFSTNILQAVDRGAQWLKATVLFTIRTFCFRNLDNSCFLYKRTAAGLSTNITQQLLYLITWTLQ